MTRQSGAGLLEVLVASLVVAVGVIPILSNLQARVLGAAPFEIDRPLGWPRWPRSSPC